MFTHMQIVERSKSWPYSGPEGYRAALPNESQNWENIPEAIQVTAGHEPYECAGDGEGGECCCTDIYVPVDRAPVEDCIPEFDDHDDHSDCVWMLDQMDAGIPDDRDYSAWYGGERGYNDGLRWSDFV